MSVRTQPKVPAELRKSRLLVLTWNQHFFGDEFVEPVTVPNPGGDDIALTFTTDRSRLADADAVWFHGPTIESLPEKHSGQPWVMMSMESEANYPVLSAPDLDRYFEITMTYRLASDVPCVYPSWREYGSFMDPPPAHRAAESPCVYIASNPVRYRDDYVRELMREIPVDCLGRCLANARPSGFVTGDDIWARGGWDSILDALRRYRFYIAFENSVTEDYVTERVFHALACGTVPIYYGAPNVREFMPDNDAVIVATEFDSPARLAEYLWSLERDPSAYARHLGWKERGYSEHFREIVDLGNIDRRSRLAVKLAHGCPRACRCGGRLR